MPDDLSHAANKPKPPAPPPPPPPRPPPPPSPQPGMSDEGNAKGVEANRTYLIADELTFRDLPMAKAEKNLNWQEVDEAASVTGEIKLAYDAYKAAQKVAVQQAPGVRRGIHRGGPKEEGHRRRSDASIWLSLRQVGGRGGHSGQAEDSIGFQDVRGRWWHLANIAAKPSDVRFGVKRTWLGSREMSALTQAEIGLLVLQV